MFYTDSLDEADRPPSRAWIAPAAKALGSSRRARSGRPVPRFPIAPERRAFRKRFYPDATAQEWNDWRWQARNRIRTLGQLERIFDLSPDERAAVARLAGGLPVGITPYYASLMGRDDPQEPLRRTHIPVGAEFVRAPGEADDPLGEDHDTVVPGLVHRYPDRVLFLVTGFCSTYCRYCTRSRIVGKAGGEYHFSLAQWQRALAWIEEHPQIRDVLLSGGDPLTLGEDRIDWLLGRLRRIRHVEFIRIGSKVPVVLPQRIGRDLIRVLRRHRPLWMSLHFTHPSELTPELSVAVGRLADAGIPLGAQTVLLRGINDDANVLKQLFHGLLRLRVRPYYLYQCDPIRGSAHFRTPVERGLELMAALRGHTSGYAVPTFVVDAPGGGGKIPLLPNPVVGRDGDDLLLRNFEGKVFRYPDPGGQLGSGQLREEAPCASV